MKKQLFAMALALAVILSGCGGGTAPASEQSSSVSGSVGAAAVTASVSEPSEEPSEEIMDFEEAAQASREEPAETEESPAASQSVEGFSGTATITETVLVDEQDVRITATDLTYGSWSATIDLLIENNSNQDLSFHSGTISYSCNAVNGYAVGAYLNEDVTAGNKVNADVTINYEELTAFGITEIAEVELGFEIETDDYDDYLETGPRKLETSAAASYDLTEDTYQEAVADGRLEAVLEGEILSFVTGDFYSSNGMNLISAALLRMDDSYAVLLELENTSEQVMRFRYGDFAINNLVVSSSSWDSQVVNPGGRGVLAVNIGNMLEPEEYEAFGLGEPSSIAFHADLWDADANNIEEDTPVEIAFSDAETAVDTTGEELYNANGVQILYKGTSSGDSLYYYVLLTIINNTENTIYISDEYDSAAVNGFMVGNNSYSRTIAPGQAGGMLFGLSLNDLEDNDIDTDAIETISFQLNIGSGSFYNYIDEPKLTIENP